jgi:hypothetical protein
VVLAVLSLRLALDSVPLNIAGAKAMTDLDDMSYPELEFVVEVRSQPGERTRRYTDLSRAGAEVLAKSLVRYGNFEARVLRSDAQRPALVALHRRPAAI